MASGIEREVVLSQIRLPIAAESVAYARQFVTATFGAWSLPGTDDAELLVSEIVTNVVRHVGACDDPMCVSVARRDDRVRVDVHDPSSEKPRPRKAGELDESGHGLYLVEALSADWGCARPDKIGKVVWFEVFA
jgi:anti-sigma regulatory factor (Ser/Thr protein kinase)